MAEKKRTFTPEQRQRWNEYSRQYRAENPEKVRRWTQNYILRKAEKLRAEMEKNGEGNA